jgi:hypothetical protein
MTREKKFHQEGDLVREYTDAEYAQFELDKIEAQKLADEIATKAINKTALLTKLGITADEAKLLLG